MVGRKWGNVWVYVCFGGRVSVKVAEEVMPVGQKCKGEERGGAYHMCTIQVTGQGISTRAGFAASVPRK